MADTHHPTPMLDDLETGPWPSFVSGIKRLRDKHDDERIRGVANSLLGQLEHSYETRKGYWKGRYSIGFWVWKWNHSSLFRSRFCVSRIKGVPYPASPASCRKLLHNGYAATAWRKLGEMGLWACYLSWTNREHHVYRCNNGKHTALF